MTGRQRQVRVGLSEDQIAGEPMTQFARWMDDALASGMPEPTAMVLSTITAEGRPRARTVLLKAHDQAGFTFYSNRTSRKGGNSPRTRRPAWCSRGTASQRQVIVEGKVRELSQAESEPYYRSRPRAVPDRGVGQQAVDGDRVPGCPGRSRRRAGATLAGARAGADA